MIKRKNKEDTKKSIDKEVLDGFVNAIVKRIKDEIAEELNLANIEFCATGIVAHNNGIPNGQNGSVKFAFDDTPINDIPNLTGVDLKYHDKVKVFYNKRNMEGAYIGVKF